MQVKNEMILLVGKEQIPEYYRLKTLSNKAERQYL